MSHELGAYLGGVRCLRDLRERCHIDDVTGCWLWRLACSQKSARVHVRKKDGKYMVMRGRRAALYLRDGVDPPAGHTAFASDDCKSIECCNPAHARSGDRVTFGAYQRRTGSVRGLHTKQMAALRTARTASAKLDAEKVRYIRETDRSTYDLAREFGVAQNTIHAARVGKTWRLDGARNSSVFNMARQAA